MVELVGLKVLFDEDEFRARCSQIRGFEGEFTKKLRADRVREAF